MTTPGKPDLEHLVRALTAEGRPDELTGRDDAVAAFRAARRGDRAGEAAGRRRVPVRRPPATRPLAAAAAVVVIVAAITTAAYTRALPRPAQDLAHTVFAPLGVPGGRRPGGSSPGPAPGTGSAGVTSATSRANSGRTDSGGAGRAPSPRAGQGYLLIVAVTRARVPAGAAVTLAGRVTRYGRPAAWVRVRLAERPAGSTRFEPVATGVTGPLGRFRLPSPPLTRTSFFRVLGPGGTYSAAVRVTVNVRPGPA